MAQIKRIAFLCHPYHRGGVTRWMSDAAVQAAEAGAEVWFITVSPQSPFLSSGGREPMVALMSPHIEKLNLVTRSVGFEFEFGSEMYRANVYAALVKTGAPEGTPIIVSDDMAVWAAAAAVADRYPMVGVLHGDQDYYTDKAARFESQLALAVCVSARVRTRLLKRCPDFAASRIFVIPCGIILPPEREHEADPSKTRLAFIGRVSDYEKRAYDLVTICATLHRAGFNFSLDIVGSSVASGEEYQKKFEAVGVGDRVRFHGWQSAASVAETLNATDIVMLTSNSEGMPLVMMEALGAGCGFVGTRVSGIEDYEHHALATDCVRVYTVGNTEEASAAVSELANVAVSKRKVAARQLAQEEFTMKVCLDRYEAALSQAKCENILPEPILLSAIGRGVSIIRAVVRYFRVKMLAK